MTTFCSSCGTPASPGAAFCSGCGQRVVAPQVNCPTCGQVWANAPTTPVQAAGNYAQPTGTAPAWPAPAPSLDPAGLASFPAPTPNLTNLQSFPPPQQATASAPVKLPIYGKDFVEGKHCGNCGADIEQGALECSNCQTSDFAIIPGASIKNASINVNPNTEES